MNRASIITFNYFQGNPADNKVTINTGGRKNSLTTNSKVTNKGGSNENSSEQKRKIQDELESISTEQESVQVNSIKCN